MQTIFWAFGSMLLLLLFISFLPLGFNFKGKFTLVLAAFAIASGGLAIVELFPLWQTLVILLVLIATTAYILDSRLGKVIYKSFLPDEEIWEESENSYPRQHIVKNNELDLLDLDEVELPSSPIHISPSTSPIQPDLLQAIEDEADISLLKDRDSKNQVEDNDDIQIVGGYLSEIESILLEESDKAEKKIESVEESWLDELADLETVELNETDKEVSKPSEIPFDDDELELLVAFKEVATGKNDHLEPIKSKVLLELQK
jgi:hypothetical protein